MTRREEVRQWLLSLSNQLIDGLPARADGLRQVQLEELNKLDALTDAQVIEQWGESHVGHTFIVKGN